MKIFVYAHRESASSEDREWIELNKLHDLPDAPGYRYIIHWQEPAHTFMIFIKEGKRTVQTITLRFRNPAYGAGTYLEPRSKPYIVTLNPQEAITVTG